MFEAEVEVSENDRRAGDGADDVRGGVVKAEELDVGDRERLGWG